MDSTHSLLPSHPPSLLRSGTTPTTSLGTQKFDSDLWRYKKNRGSLKNHFTVTNRPGNKFGLRKMVVVSVCKDSEVGSLVEERFPLHIPPTLKTQTGTPPSWTRWYTCPDIRSQVETTLSLVNSNEVRNDWSLQSVTGDHWRSVTTITTTLLRPVFRKE